MREAVHACFSPLQALNDNGLVLNLNFSISLYTATINTVSQKKEPEREMPEKCMLISIQIMLKKTWNYFAHAYSKYIVPPSDMFWTCSNLKKNL